MATTMLTLSIIFLFYLLGIIYSTITGEKPGNTISVNEINNSTTSKGNGWAILTPIAGLLALVYNFFITSFWAIGVLINFIASILKWIWNEVIVAGGFFIFQIIWHYFIKWPWKIFLLAFNKIRDAAKWKYFLIGSIAITASLFITFLGKFMVQTFDWWNGLNVIAGILAIIPIGIGIAKIIQHTITSTNEDELQSSSNYTTHLFYIIGAFIILIIIEGSVIYIGTFTSFSSSLSALFAGGNLLGSFLIIINSILLLFGISALPSFSSTYQGENKDILKSFLQYLTRNWAKYVIAIPAFIFPAILISIIPYFLTQGISFVSGNVSDAVFEYRIGELSKALENTPKANYAEWLDVSKVKDEDLKSQIEKDIYRVKSSASLNEASATKNYLNEFYSIHSSPWGAAPIMGVYLLYEKINESENNAIKTSPNNSLTINDKETLEMAKTIDNTLIPEKTKSITSIENRISQLNQALMAVCDTSKKPVQENQISPANNKEESQVSLPTPPFDNCAIQKAAIRKQINDQSDSKQMLKNQLARASAVSEHLKRVLHINESQVSASKSSSTLSYFLVSIWLCILIGLAFGAILPLFALLNHALFLDDDSITNLYVLDKIQQSNSVNKNQPLLGILLFPIFGPLLLKGLLLITSLGGNTSWNENKVWDIFKNLGGSYKSLLDFKIPEFNNQEVSNAPIIKNDAIADSIAPAQEAMADTVAADAATVDTTAAPFTTTVYAIDEVDTKPGYSGTFNYNKKTAQENGGGDNEYKVTVSFIVDANGNVTDITPLTSVGYSTEAEIITKINETSGNWTPARKNGENVSVRLQYDFTFGVNQ